MPKREPQSENHDSRPLEIEAEMAALGNLPAIFNRFERLEEKLDEDIYVAASHLLRILDKK